MPWKTGNKNCGLLPKFLYRDTRAIRSLTIVNWKHNMMLRTQDEFGDGFPAEGSSIERQRDSGV